jgi:flagellar biosynthesis/type III secretory pathway protein FliH
MNGLIKSARTAEVRPFGRAQALPESGFGVAREDPRLVEAIRENEALRAELATLKAAAATAVRTAREEGLRAGEASAKSLEEEKLKALQAGLRLSGEALATRLEELEALAVLVARTALSKLFDESQDQRERIAGLIARQLRDLRRECILAVRVSAQDFGDEAALADLSKDARCGSIRVIADGDLPAGDCRLDLKLGHVEIGPRAQWSELATLLGQFLGGGDEG